MVAGATGIDLFLLVVDAAEGARPQTHEHLAILRLLGVEHGVVAVTKADAVDDETLELARRGGARARSRGGRSSRSAASTGAGLDELRGALARAAADIASTATPTPRRGSTSTACSRCAGSAPSSRGRSGRARSARATSCGSSRQGATCASASVQVHDTAGRARGGGPAGRRQPAGDRAPRRPPRRRARRARRVPALVPPRRRARASSSRSPTAPASRCTTARAGSPRASSASGSGHAQLRLAAPGRRGARRPRRAPAARRRVGGGVVLDPAPPRRVDAERDRAARARAIRRRSSGAGPRAGLEALAAARCSSGRARGRARRRPRRRTAGRSRTTWLEETGAAGRGAAPHARRASPLDPGVPLAELLPASRGRRACSRCCPSSAAAPRSYLPGRPPALGARADAAAELERGARRAPGSRRRRSTTPSSRASSRRRAARPARRRLSPSAPAAYEVATRPRRARVRAAAGEITLARFRDLAGVGPPRRAAPARALRRGRPHAPGRRPARASASGSRHARRAGAGRRRATATERSDDGRQGGLHGGGMGAAAEGGDGRRPARVRQRPELPRHVQGGEVARVLPQGLAGRRQPARA